MLHGGTDFDHHQLLPEMDRLAGSFRLVYHDQRGRGRSSRSVSPEDVDLDSEMQDLGALRRTLRLDSFAVLGHSWGGLLAAEYATRHRDRVTRLILMNTALVSHAGLLAMRRHLAQVRSPEDAAALESLRASARYRSGDVEADEDYHRIDFRVGLPSDDHLDTIVGRLRASFTPESILRARAIEASLYEQTRLRPEYDLLPRLGDLFIPTLVLHGDADLIPVEVAAAIATAMPAASLAVLPR
jgi:proline iminopeptidase